jgi:hypothetical protein
MASNRNDTMLVADERTAQHLIGHRRAQHAVPELAFKERDTSRYIAERLDDLKVENLRGDVAGTGWSPTSSASGPAGRSWSGRTWTAFQSRKSPICHFGRAAAA